MFRYFQARFYDNFSRCLYAVFQHFWPTIQWICHKALPRVSVLKLVFRVIFVHWISTLARLNFTIPFLQFLWLFFSPPFGSWIYYDFLFEPCKRNHRLHARRHVLCPLWNYVAYRLRIVKEFSIICVTLNFVNAAVSFEFYSWTLLLAYVFWLAETKKFLFILN